MCALLARKGGFSLERVVFCTAVPDDPADKRDRHTTFNRAQQSRGVEIIKGHHVWNDTDGKFSEKQSDINVALSLITDAQDDVMDVAYLISADSDQAATARVFRERYTSKELVCVAPPGRRPPTKCVQYADRSFTMKMDLIERCVMPELVKSGDSFIRRPARYAPPQGWVHPHNRPQFKDLHFGL